MKFGQELKQHSIDEWRKAYINYRFLKKLIGRAELELEELDESGGVVPTPAAVHLLVDGAGNGIDSQGGGGGFTESPPTSPRLRKEEVQASQTVTPPKEGERSGARDLEDGEPSSEGESSGTAKQDPVVYDSIPESVIFPGNGERGKTTRPSKPSAGPVGGLMRGLTMRKGSIALGNDDGVAAKDKKWRYSPDTPLSDLLEQLPPGSRKFFTVLDREFDRVSEFYGARELDAVRRYKNLEDQWKALEEHKREYQEYQANGVTQPKILIPIVAPIVAPFQRSSSGLKKRSTSARKVTDDSPSDAPAGKTTHFARSRPEEYAQSKAKLKVATFEYYRFLGLLKGYKVLNQTGFSKSLKKFEKSTKIPCAKSYGLKLVDANFIASTKLDDLIRKTEDGYTKFFMHGNRKEALGKLRMSGDAQTAHHATVYRSGFFIGIGLVLLLEGIVKAAADSTHQAIPYWTSLLQLFGAMFLPVLFSLLFAINLISWHRARINYVLVFELDVRTRMDYKEFLELPSLLFALFSLFFWLSFSNFWPTYIAASAYPLAFMVTALTILLAPLPILHQLARWWMVRSFARVITAGLIKVEFRDFFLGDELNSLYYTMYNLGFLVCTYQKGWPSNVGDICATNSTWTSPILAALPAFWRLGQSVRRYIDSDGDSIHLYNSGKYSASILYFFLYFNWRINGSDRGGRFAVWVLFAVINSLYTASWDLIMDWSLCRKKAKGQTYRFLRPELGFKDHIPFYYFAIVTNSILRFAWVIYLPTDSRLPSVQVRGFVNALLEVFRRIQWNAIRVESEHIGNVDGFRITRDVALPYTNLFEVPKDLSVNDDPDTRNSKQRVFSFLHELNSTIHKNLSPLKDMANVFGKAKERPRRKSIGMESGLDANGVRTKDFAKRGAKRYNTVGGEDSSGDENNSEEDEEPDSQEEDSEEEELDEAEAGIALGRADAELQDKLDTAEAMQRDGDGVIDGPSSKKKKV